MEKSPTSAEFLSEIVKNRTEWSQLISKIPLDAYQKPAAGKWSVKDIIAHVAWFEWEMIGMLEQRAFAGSELWGLEPDQRNEAIYQKNKNTPLRTVLEDERQAYQKLFPLVKTLTDEELAEPSRFRDMPGDIQPWMILAENLYAHYKAHFDDLQLVIT